ncbi:MAG: hypothetical protein LBT56_00875 [Prevotellaceae bacterium]|jgi:membrane-anchored glycerophosphoryl diester phosphodiesterase (GDPDase)|nr:hypothetical protein [Prevotellaceae bacterium]
MNKRKINKRAIISIGLLITLVLTVVTAYVLDEFGTPVWRAAHSLCGKSFLVFAVFHTIYNLKVLKKYFRKGNKKIK